MPSSLPKRCAPCEVSSDGRPSGRGPKRGRKAPLTVPPPTLASRLMFTHRRLRNRLLLKPASTGVVIASAVAAASATATRALLVGLGSPGMVFLLVPGV